MPAISLAYKFVATALMLAEVNYCSSNLHLQGNFPLKDQDIKMVAVFDPKLVKFAGRIDAENYSFSFVKSGRLRYVTKLDEAGRQSYGIYRGNQSISDCLKQLAYVRSTISSNDAYRISTNWLALVGVNVQKLEADKTSQVEQQFLESSEKGLVPIPLFYVKWGGHSEPAVSVMISGISGELLNLRQEDDSYSKRPVSLIKNMDKLLAIPDEEFLKMSPLEKSNLVVRFAAVQYSAPVLPAAAQNTNGVPPP